MQYDPRWRVLLIAFRASGEVYRYYDVPRQVWDAFIAAPSKGTFLNENLKAMAFRFERADPRECSDGELPNGFEVWPPTLP